MREESLSREVRYGKQDIAELESASIQVHLIYKKLRNCLNIMLIPARVTIRTQGKQFHSETALGRNWPRSSCKSGFRHRQAGNVLVVK